MSTSIPYSPSLVLGSVVQPAAMRNLLQISALQAPIDAAQETLNSYISMKRSLDMTTQELINMNLDPKDLVQKVKEVSVSVDKAAADYARVSMEQEQKLQPLRAKMQTVNANVESPIDYNRTILKPFTLAADSLKLDAQYFSLDENAESVSNTLSNIRSYVSGSTSFMGAEASFDIATTAVNQVSHQLRTHKIAGTLVLTASCTHKDATMLAPMVLDVDKAIRVWNQLYEDEKDKIRMDARVVEQIASEEGTSEEKAMYIVSGASFGSSFVGMVHVLRTDSTTTSQSMQSSALSVQSKLDMGAWFANRRGAFGVDSSFAEDVKSLLSSANIQAHVTLITTGIIPKLEASSISMVVDQIADFDPSKMMEKLVTMEALAGDQKKSVSQSAEAARTTGELVSFQTAKIENMMAGLSKRDETKNQVLDVNSMITAYEDYIDCAVNGTANGADKGVIGVPINYYVKPITRAQLAQMWMAKYFPDKFLMISGDESAAQAAQQAQGKK